MPPFRNNDEDSWKVDTALAAANAGALALIPALIDASITQSQAVSLSLSMFAFGVVCALIALAYDQALIAWDRIRGQNRASGPLMLAPRPWALVTGLLSSLIVACLWPREPFIAMPALAAAFVMLLITVVLRYGLAALVLRTASFAALTAGVFVTLAAQAASGTQTSAIGDHDGASSINTIVRHGPANSPTTETWIAKPRPESARPDDKRPGPETRPPTRRHPPQGLSERPAVLPLDHGGEKG